MLIVEDQNLDKRVLRTRMALREAFGNLMHEKPFEQITVSDITERAMINRATFYAHFNDKYELFDYMLRYIFHEHLVTILADADALTYDNLRNLAFATLTFLQKFIGHCAPSERNNTLPFEMQLQACLFDVLMDWLDGSEASTQLIATATSSSILSAGLYYARGKSELERETYIDQLMDILMHGIDAMILSHV